VRERLTIRNHRDQPIELHLRSQVLVMGPRGVAEVDAEEAGVAQVAVLARHRVISLWPAKPARPEGQAQAEKPKQAQKSKGKQTHAEGDE
jgi:hypothetical protein